MPYRGLDEWVRTVLPLGASALVLLAALLAFWPRSRGRLGFPALALLVLTALFVVPIVALDFTVEFLRGAVFTVLMVAFLRLEKLRRPDGLAAGVLAIAITLVALVAAPLLNKDTPWFDYETWALQTSSSKSTTFTWDHSYDGLNWPRDGRELLRVRAQRPAYWKADNLDTFDGEKWLRSTVDYSVPEYPTDPERVEDWTQTIRVSIRNLRIGHVHHRGLRERRGHPAAVRHPDGGRPLPLTAHAAPRRHVHGRGLHAAAAAEPARARRAPTSIRRCRPTRRSTRPSSASRASHARPDDVPVLRLPRSAASRSGRRTTRRPSRCWPRTGSPAPTRCPSNCSRTPRRRRITSRPSSNYLGDESFTYTESPPPAARTLEGFLFDAKTGYCQQYSGAMALLLRMGGIPARVVTGFSTGATDTKTDEYVVRDFDAHSWVEVYYPDWGWITFDPTPAASPARSQPADAASSGSATGGSVPRFGDVADRARRGRRRRGRGQAVVVLADPRCWRSSPWSGWCCWRCAAGAAGRRRR